MNTLELKELKQVLKSNQKLTQFYTVNEIDKMKFPKLGEVINLHNTLTNFGKNN